MTKAEVDQDCLSKARDTESKGLFNGACVTPSRPKMDFSVALARMKQGARISRMAYPGFVLFWVKDVVMQYADDAGYVRAVPATGMLMASINGKNMPVNADNESLAAEDYIQVG